jgi:predicted MFS family arabinose efflux permease
MLTYLAGIVGVILGIILGNLFEWLMGPMSIPCLIALVLYLFHVRRRQQAES